MGSASRRGILFRDGGVLEALRKVDAVVLDKTGTITEGNFSVLDFEVCTQEEPAAVMMAAGKAPLDANSTWASVFRAGLRARSLGAENAQCHKIWRRSRLSRGPRE